ncbi:unnamed protein product, partial [Staurois parvus]
MSCQSAPDHARPHCFLHNCPPLHSFLCPIRFNLLPRP